MKRIRMFLALLLAAFAATVAVSLSSCDENNKVMPIYRYVVKVNVVDSEGNNLLNPDNPDNLIDKLNCVITYIDRTHGIFWIEPSYFTDSWPWTDKDDEMEEYYIPHFYGVWYYQSNGLDNCLAVGEFDGLREGTEKFTLEFPEYGLKYNFELIHKYLEEDNTLKVNGEKVYQGRDPEFTVVLP